MSDLERLSRALAALLEREASFLENAAGRLSRDRGAFLSGSARALASGEAEWNALLRSRSGSDRERAVLMDKICALIGEPADRLTVSKICRQLEPPSAKRLREAAAAASRAGRKAALEAAVGGDLLEESARIQEGLIRRLFAEARPNAASYGPVKGKADPALSLLDAIG